MYHNDSLDPQMLSDPRQGTFVPESAAVMTIARRIF
jgi:hypothetical protein